MNATIGQFTGTAAQLERDSQERTQRYVREHQDLSGAFHPMHQDLLENCVPQFRGKRCAACLQMVPDANLRAVWPTGLVCLDCLDKAEIVKV